MKSVKYPLQVAFIGGGINSAVGYAHFCAARLDGCFNLVSGCFSRNHDINKKSAEYYGVDSKRVYSNWKFLLEKEFNILDAVIVLTPTPDHSELVLFALSLGVPVICEKSLGVSSGECYEIEKVRSDKSGFLAVTFNYSGYPMVRELKTVLEKGKLGKLQQIHIEMPQEGFLRKNVSPQQWRCNDYVIPTVSLDLGVHVYHLVDFITGGKKPIKLLGDQASYSQVSHVIDNVYCIAHYEDDVRVVCWWGKSALGCRNGLRVRVFASEGSADWYQESPEILQISNNNGNRVCLDRCSPDISIASLHRYNRFKPGHPSGFIEAFANLYVDIAECLTNDKPESSKSEYVHGSLDAARGLEFLERISESSKLEKWLRV